MINFVDIHSHSLPNVDDGAKNTSMMEKMIDIAYNDGIRTICFTPHFKLHHFRDEEDVVKYNERVKSAFQSAVDYASSKYNDLKLLLGNEILWHSSISDSLADGNCSFLGKDKLVLVEFMPSVSAYELKNAIISLLRKGYKPLIAHIERYECLSLDTSLLEELKQHGALFQINALSITKFKLGKRARFIKRVLASHLVDVVASDAHDDKHFAPVLSLAYQRVLKKHGQKYADRIFSRLPSKILGTVQ